jgi:hypothetical protein
MVGSRDATCAEDRALGVSFVEMIVMFDCVLSTFSLRGSRFASGRREFEESCDCDKLGPVSGG